MTTEIAPLPPCSIEAELTVLGGLMFDSNAMEIVGGILTPESFYLVSHQKVFAIIQELYQRGQVPDLRVVAQLLTDRGLLDSVGGRSTLVTMLNSCASTANLDNLAILIAEKHTHRQLISAGEKIKNIAVDSYIDTPDKIAESEKILFKINQKQYGDRYTVSSAQDMAVELFESLENGSLEGEKLGWYDLESLTSGVISPCLEIVAAESHMGKTHYMMRTAYDIMTKLRKPVLYITPEMSKEQINNRMLAMISGIDSGEIRANRDRYWEQISQAIDTFSGLPWYVYDHESPSVQLIASIIKKTITQAGGLGAVFIDYLQELPLQNNGNMAFEIGKIVRAIRGLAKYHSLPIYLGCQINRGNQNNNDKRPNRHLLRNSGEIFEVCDRLVMLYRPGVYSKDPSDHTVELIVEKNRLTGKIGTATMLCDLRTSSFLNMAR